MNIDTNNAGDLKNKYKIPVRWTMEGHVEVMAENLDEAWEIASTSPLPSEGQYVWGSFTVDSESDYEVENAVDYTENINFLAKPDRMFTR